MLVYILIDIIVVRFYKYIKPIYYPLLKKKLDYLIDMDIDNKNFTIL